MICEACARGNHLGCEPVPDPDVEMRFTDCTCLCDPQQVQRFEHARILLVEAQEALRASRDEACCAALRRALVLLAPPLRKPPLRKFSIVVGGCGRTTDQEYAAASGEPIPKWMTRTHGDKR